MSKDEITATQDTASSDRDIADDNERMTAEAAVKAVKAGRAKDVDIAARFIAQHGHELHGDDYTKAEEKQIIRRVDWRLVPIVSFFLFLISLREHMLSRYVKYGRKDGLLTSIPPTALRLRHALGTRQDGYFCCRYL